MLQSIAPANGEADDLGDRLWLGRWGRPLSGRAIWHQIRSRTEQAFGKAIRPHLFRDCAVTELVDSAPDQIGIAPTCMATPTCRPRADTTSRPRA